ncbi:phosphoribosylglycinamide formyltransferase [Tepidibacillus fermentans]|uniref:Phosphoribosylglycinamide formyltransferase n=1 Tax=Tepidibacillus fermentans TaxID=1281767 RepID=A0A4R3KD91_9BACI|nr:phosphoribosylglycinamide formyltransferase [Tepidibacillus fermentans]TCS80611.1 formyltetrahydrofolate-dependent phosphoribosylglycinamide formyltransferase [Tepidibacillus fermentans]
MNQIAVFASGNGSNFQSLIDAEKRGELQAQVKLLVTDRPDSYVVFRAKREGIPVFAFRPKEFENKSQYEKVIIQKLQEFQIDFIVLAGYMRIVGKDLLEAYPNRIINLHPSLLPAFPGKNAIEQAYLYGVKWTGVTVHFVDAGIDTGPILLQEVVEIRDEDTIETLEERIHQVEHQLLVKAVNLVFDPSYQFIERAK